MAELNPPGYLSQLGHPPDALRRAFKSAVGDQAQVVQPGDLNVTTTGTDPLAVSVAAGSAFIAGTSRPDEQGFYHVTSDSPVIILLTAAHATLYRRDLIVAQILDDEEDSGGINEWQLADVTGTPASIGAAVPPAVPDNSLVLAEILISPTSIIVLANNITDQRPMSVAQSRPKGAIDQARVFNGGYDGNITTAEETSYELTFEAEANRYYQIHFAAEWNASTNNRMTTRVRRGVLIPASPIRSAPPADTGGARFDGVNGTIVDTPPAGTVTYRLTHQVSTGTAGMIAVQLYALDLGPVIP